MFPSFWLDNCVGGGGSKLGGEGGHMTPQDTGE